MERMKQYIQSNPRMEQDLFTNIPSEITIDILSRLPIGSVMNCKLVIKSWRSLIETPEFAKLYKSGPCLVASHTVKGVQNPFQVYEVEDGDGNSKNSCNKAFNFSFPEDDVLLNNSVNGLLFMLSFRRIGSRSRDMYICNPVTREYITVTCPGYHSPEYDRWEGYESGYGFGVSRKSRQFKVFKVFDTHTDKDSEEEGEEEEEDQRARCQVYTLGTGQWRNVAITPSKRPVTIQYSNIGAFFNGNFHMLADDYMDNSQWISSFDLETEVFTTFCAPNFADPSPSCSLVVVRDCLGVCDNSSADEMVIWLMKEYRDEKSWTKQYVIPKMGPKMGCDLSWLIHVFKDGDMLLTNWTSSIILHYSDKTKAIEKTDLIGGSSTIMPLSYTPSFLPLKTFSSMENVSSMSTHFN